MVRNRPKSCRGRRSGNVNDDATTPQAAKWTPNITDPTRNNFRQNQQGKIAPTALADVTSDQVDCSLRGNVSVLSAEVCNRGIKTVGAGELAVEPARDGSPRLSFDQSDVTEEDARGEWSAPMRPGTFARATLRLSGRS